MISDDELAARNCLRSGSFLIDPKYLAPESKPYEKLKERCRACWAMRAFFPDFVKKYMEQWEKEQKERSNA
jgi:hypothetical protein